MRKILFTIIAVLVLVQPVMAEFVRPDVAARYAQGILGMKESPVPENSVQMLAAGRDGQASAPEYYVFAGMREKLAQNDVPSSFRGLPVALITVGIMAMAFLGFSGIV